MAAESTHAEIAFIGGGNMASALIGGLLKAGQDGAGILVIEPDAAQRQRLVAQFAVRAQGAADAGLAGVPMLVWAVKPQSFAQAALACVGHVDKALHLSVMAGIRCAAIARACGADPAQARIVRSMPNTPALIGRGIAGLFATPAVSARDRAQVEAVLAPTGQTLWLDREADLDAVTALSGSGPAYVFYFVEAMVAAAVEMGLSAKQGRQLALATFDGASALAERSDEALATLRERVTSKGGTTYAALEAMRASGVAEAITQAVRAAQRRAAELGDEFGR